MTLNLSGTLFPGSLDSTFALLSQLRPIVESLQESKIAYEVTWRAVQAIDFATIRNKSVERPLSQARNEIMDEARSDSLHPSSDLSFTLTLIPSRGNTLVLVQTHTPAWESLLDNLGGINYDYWSSSEAPENVTDAEWLERKTRWTEALAPSWIPAKAGLLMDMGEKPFAFPAAKKLLDYLPSEERRIQAVATQVYIGANIKEPFDHTNLTKLIFQWQDLSVEDKQPYLERVKASLLPITETLLLDGI